MAEKSSPNGGSRVHDTIERLKKHPVLSVILFSSALIGAVAVLWGAVVSSGDLMSDIIDPNKEQYAALDAIDLDVRLEFFEENFGTAKSVVNACEHVDPCPNTGTESPQLYIFETGEVVVRALFEGNSLRAYLVTTRVDSFNPDVTWLGHDLGKLGQASIAEMLAVPAIQPTDTSVFSGPRSMSYAEVFAAGAPARYRGLILAWSPEGSQTDLDVDAAQEVAIRSLQEEDTVPADTLSRLRENTVPNTFGEFRDDGRVGEWLHSAEVARSFLHVKVDF